MMRLHGMVLALAAMVALGACGDSPTRDTRGYTKAPLEDPNVRIRSEEPTVMDELGDPVLPVVVDPDEFPTEAQQASPSAS